MPLSDSDKQTMQEIIDTQGACLDSKRCQKCPFRSACLPEFLNPNPPSQPQRLQMAMDILAHNYLIDDDITIEEAKEEFAWDKK